MNKTSRREFVRNVSLGTVGAGLSGMAHAAPQDNGEKGRQVWIAALTQHQIRGDTYRDNVAAALRQMGNAIPFGPDIICLPEFFHVAGVKEPNLRLDIVSEDGTGNIIGPFQDFARQHQCYVICPIYTAEQGRYYNAAVLIDRNGKYIGEYRKARLPVDEMEMGLTPGPLDPPVFKLDFGTVGIQICFDMEWDTGWRSLNKKGAEIVFWPSAFAGGKKVNTKAWENQYYVVSSTLKDTTKICDITGEEVAASGIWKPWGVCAPVNLEKAFLHSWPYSLTFADIEKKYGRNVRCYSLYEEEFSIIESLSPRLKVADIIREFGLKTYKEHLREAEDLQERRRV